MDYLSYLNTGAFLPEEALDRCVQVSSSTVGHTAAASLVPLVDKVLQDTGGNVCEGSLFYLVQMKINPILHYQPRVRWGVGQGVVLQWS